MITQFLKLWAWMPMTAILILLCLSSGVIADAGENLTTDLWAYWSLDDEDLSGTTSIDIAGVYNGTLTGSPTTGISAYIAEGYDFDGVDDEFDTTSNIGITGAADRSMFGFVRTAVNTGDVKFFGWGSASTRANWRFMMSAGGTWKIWGYFGDCDENDAGQLINDSTWHHIGATLSNSGQTIRLYRDGVNTENCTVTALNTANTDFEIGHQGGGANINSDFDEIAVYNRTLADHEVMALYSLGTNPLDVDADYLTVNIVSPPSGVSFGEGNSSFNVSYNGTGSPTDVADCSLWVDGVLNQSSSAVNLSVLNMFELSLFDEGKNYSINVECNASLYANSSIVLYYGDTFVPVVDIDDPVNGSNWITGDIPFDCDATDANLYRFNMTVYDRNGTVKYSHEQINILGTTATNSTTLPYNSFSASQNLSDWHMLNCTAADAHTGETLTEDVTPEKPALNRVEFPFERGTVTVEVEHSGELEKFDVLQETDRYSFDLGFSKDVSEVVYRIYAHRMTPVVKDDYPCHLVINDDLTGGYWFDAFTSNMERCELTSRGGYYEARVTLKTPQKSLESRSVGELNVVTESVYFTTYTPPVLAVNWSLTCGGKYPTNTHTLNFSGQGLSNCTLLIDGYVYDDWSGDCDAIDIEVPLGWATMTLQSATVNSSCTVYFDKVNKSLADYAIITILLIIWVVLFICNLTLRGPRGKTIQVLNSLQGLIGVIAGLNFITYSQPVGIAVAVFAAGVWLMLITESGKR